MIEQTIDKYGKRLYGLCMTLCKSSFDANDLYQETWLKVCCKLTQYDQNREFEGWLTQICVNTYRDSLRRKKLSPFFETFLSQKHKDTAMENVTAKTDPDYSDLHQAIDALPDKLRMTVILYYFRDLDISLTAKALDVPPGTVKSRLSKAKKLLKERLRYEIEL